jgi:hypothetical protein
MLLVRHGHGPWLTVLHIGLPPAALRRPPARLLVILNFYSSSNHLIENSICPSPHIQVSVTNLQKLIRVELFAVAKVVSSNKFCLLKY